MKKKQNAKVGRVLNVKSNLLGLSRTSEKPVKRIKALTSQLPYSIIA